jgi:hypothetical protein
MWKEWRQTRALFLALAGGTALFVGGCCLWPAVAGTDPDLGNAAVETVIILSALLLPAAAFAGERAAGQWAFLRRQPIAPTVLVFVKWLVPWVLWCGLAILAQRLRYAFGVAPGLQATFGDTSDTAFVMAILLFHATLVTSALVRRPAVAALAGGVAGVALFLMLAGVVGAVLGAPLDLRNRNVVGVLAIGGLLSLLMARAIVKEENTEGMTGRQRARSAFRFLRLVALMSLVAIVLTGGAIVGWYHMLGPADAVEIHGVAPSPDGRHVAFCARLRQGGFSPFGRTRWCVLDTETGRSRLVARFRMASAAYPPAWSPDGRYAAFRLFASPAELLVSQIKGTEIRARVAVFDTRTGTVLDPPAAEIGSASDGQWLGPDELLIPSHEPLGLHHWRLASRTVDWIPAPTGWRFFIMRSEGTDGNPVLCTRVGEKQFGIAILDAASRNWTVRTLEKGTYLQALNAAARLALLARYPPDPDAAEPSLELLDLATGAVEPLGPAQTKGDALLVRYRFSPDGRWLVFCGASEEAGVDAIGWLRDIPARRNRRIDPPDASGDWLPRFTQDGTQLVWLYRSLHIWSTDGVDRWAPRVDDLATGARRTLSWREAARLAPIDRILAELQADRVVFTHTDNKLYRMDIDGTGLEQLFPEKRPVTEEELR